MRRVVLFYVFYCLLGFVVRAQSVAEQVDNFVRSSSLLKTSEAGIAVFDLTEGKYLYRHQSQKLSRPASTQKIITSVSALGRLGMNHTFDTELAYTGTVRNDTLHGDLYLVGGFDPLFMEEDMDSLVKAVCNAGIRVIRGKLMADVSFSDSVFWGPGWAWDDTPSSFQPYLSSLMLNKGCMKVTVSPSRAGERPFVRIVPVSPLYEIDNRAITVDTKARDLRITRDWLHNRNTIVVTGHCNSAVSEELNVISPEDFFLQTFCHRLKEQNVVFHSMAYSVCPDSVRSLYVCRRPMGEVLKEALKESDNLCAEALFHHLGARESGKRRAGFDEGEKAVIRFMQEEVGMIPSNFRIVDGSGLSPYDCISPELLIAYLKYAYYHPDIFQPFYEALPVAGVDGTLRNRMKSGKAFRNVRAKTGAVTGISTLAGYVKAANGHMLAFSIMNQNALKLSEARKFQNKICEMLAD